MMATLSVMASGMVTGLGFNAPASLAALRAGISAVQLTGWTDCETGEPLRGAKVALPQWWEGVGKLAELVAPAIDECLDAIAPTPRESVPILLGVAARERPGRLPQLDETLLDEVHARLELPAHPYSRLIALDQAAGAHALIAAQELIRRRLAQRVIVAGVDSFLRKPILDSLVKRRRLMSGDNSNGFFPGEAGCAIAVGATDTCSGRQLEIFGIGVAEESATIDSTTPLRAQGLTQAVKQALGNAGVSLGDVAYRLTDLSGEHYKFKEALFVAGRLDSGSRSAPLPLWHPVEYLGEIGAAVLPCLLAQARHAALEDYAPGPLALCHVGSDAGARAALVVGVRPRHRGERG
jgi:3-oxoacyl-[acyl-carrier-protein] synthase-1